MNRILLATPHYNGVIHGGAAKGAFMPPYISSRDDVEILPHDTGGSLLAKTFNVLWCTALELASIDRVDFFAMLHADIVPQKGWIDVLLGEVERLSADIVSVVVPIKRSDCSWENCPTSTAIGTRGETWEPFKILTNGDCAKLPATFGIAETPWPDKQLLLNTGCWLADLRRPWWFETYADKTMKHVFTVRDMVKLLKRDADGRAVMQISCESEDWAFSRRLPEQAKIYATRKVKVEHKGTHGWRNWRDVVVPAKEIEMDIKP